MLREHVQSASEKCECIGIDLAVRGDTIDARRIGAISGRCLGKSCRTRRQEDKVTGIGYQLDTDEGLD